MVHAGETVTQVPRVLVPHEPGRGSHQSPMSHRFPAKPQDRPAPTAQASLEAAPKRQPKAIENANNIVRGMRAAPFDAKTPIAFSVKQATLHCSFLARAGQRGHSSRPIPAWSHASVSVLSSEYTDRTIHLLGLVLQPPVRLIVSVQERDVIDAPVWGAAI
jgi:hypothetical protein